MVLPVQTSDFEMPQTAVQHKTLQNRVDLVHVHQYQRLLQ